MERHPHVLEAPASSVGLDQKVQNAKARIALMDAFGAKRTTFFDRSYFCHDRKTGTSILASENLIVKRDGCLTTLMTFEPGSGLRQVMKKVRDEGYSQNIAGAVVSRSQSSVSRLERECTSG